MSAEQTTISILFRGLMVAHVVKHEDSRQDFFEIGVFTDAPGHTFRIHTLNAALALGESPIASFPLDDFIRPGQPRLWCLEVDDPAAPGINLQTASASFNRVALAADNQVSEDFRWIVDLEGADFYPQGVQGVLDTARLTPVLRIPHGLFFTAELSPFLGRSRNNSKTFDRFGPVAGSTGCRIRLRSGGVRLVNEAGVIFNFENNPGFLYEFTNTPPEDEDSPGENAPHAHHHHAHGPKAQPAGGDPESEFFDHFPLYYTLFPPVFPRGIDRFAFNKIESTSGVGGGARPQLCGAVFLSRTTTSFVEDQSPESEAEGEGGAGAEGETAAAGDTPGGDSNGGPEGEEEPKAVLMEVDDSDMGRFSGISPGSEMMEPGSAWVAGVVEVELAEGAEAEFSSSEAASLVDIDAQPESGFGALKEALLQKYDSVRLEPSDRPEGENRTRHVTFRFADDLDVLRVAEDIAQLPQVKRVIPVPKAAPASTPHDEPLIHSDLIILGGPLAGIQSQWYISRCGVNAVWDQQLSGQNVVIAVLDWGFRTTHQDFGPRIEKKFNSIDGSEEVFSGDGVSHGTAVLGLVGADDNGLGMAGIAYGASYWAVQAANVANDVGPRSWVDAIKFVRDASHSDPRRIVIVLANQTAQLGNYEMIPSVNRAIREAIVDNIVVCVAAGNGDRDAGIDDVGHPIDPTGSILVGATRFHPAVNRRAPFSNFGERVVVSAPGDVRHDVTCSSHLDIGYRNRFGGTSGAVAKVAGVAALMLEARPTLTHDQVRDILRTTGTAVLSEPGKPVGTFLNAAAAVQAAIDLP